VEIIKIAGFGYMQLYGYRPKSVSVGLSCGLGWTRALFVTRSTAEVANAVCRVTLVNLTFTTTVLIASMILHWVFNCFNDSL